MSAGALPSVPFAGPEDDPGDTMVARALLLAVARGLAAGCTRKVEYPVLEPAARTFGGKASEPREIATRHALFVLWVEGAEMPANA